MRRLMIWRAGEVIREKLLRLGGDWEVVRFAPPFRGRAGSDRLIDATARLPFADKSYDAVYARRIIEHLAPDEALSFAGEIRRVLAPGGIVRLSVPDIEALARAYLDTAEQARRTSSSEALQSVRHARMMLIDQYVRRVPGGALAREIAAKTMPAATLRAAFGDALGINGAAVAGTSPPLAPPLRQTLKERLRLLAGQRWVHETHASREAHLGVYDRLSLPDLLGAAGFGSFRVVNAASSSIDLWDRWKLDVSDYGPHDFEPSLIVEAARESATHG
jgi:SAM-dependent methyltransferase